MIDALDLFIFYLNDRCFTHIHKNELAMSLDRREKNVVMI